MEAKLKIWMAVLVLAGPLMVFGGVGSETGTVAEQIVQDAENSVKRIRTVIADAQRGSPEAQFRLGMMILDKVKNLGRKRQANAAQEALPWFTRAAEQGHEDAQRHLSLLYSINCPLEMINYVRAYAWLKVALDKGASITRNGQPADKVLRKKMTAEQVAEAEKLAAEIQERIKASKSR